MRDFYATPQLAFKRGTQCWLRKSIYPHLRVTAFWQAKKLFRWMK
jgi:hypothetical protein